MKLCDGWTKLSFSTGVRFTDCDCNFLVYDVQDAFIIVFNKISGLLCLLSVLPPSA